VRPQRQSAAKSSRKPGPVPNINARAEESLGAIDRLPPELREVMRDVISPLLSQAQNQDVFNRRSRARYSSLPSPHGATHLGGQDNIVSLEDPAALAPGSDGDPGTPSGGVSAGDHVHDMSAFAFAGTLEDISTEVRNDYTVAYVYAPEEDDLLAEILVELMKMTGEI
jgi:hypothetical protein